jgi:hypothetical protein
MNQLTPHDINIGRLHAKIDALTLERDAALVSVEAEQVRTLFWKTNAEFHQGKCDSALARLKVADELIECVLTNKHHPEVYLPRLSRYQSADAGPAKGER